MKKVDKVKCWHIVVFLFIIIFLYIGINAFDIWEYSQKDEKCTTDVIIVLGASTYNDQVIPVFQERLNHGIWLYQNGYAKKMILTGGYGEGNQHSDAFVAREYVMSKGILKDDILIEENSTITQENLENAKIIMDQQSFQTAIIVSDPLHMKRAMLMAKDYDIKAYSSPTPTTKYISFQKKLSFLSRETFFFIGYKIYRLMPFHNY